MSNSEDLIRAATYAEAQTRTDLRGTRATRTGKTKKVVCTPPNKKCGGRCIPPNWDCRLEGKGTNSELNVHRNDPLAGAASIQRGIVNIREGAKKGDLARIQRGRGAIIRGAVKIAPGDNLEQKKQLRRKLTQRSSGVFAVAMVAVGAVTIHGQLKRNFPQSYGRGPGRDIDNAVGRGMDAVLDRTPLIADRRAARRAAGAAAIAGLTRAERFQQQSAVSMERALTRDYPQRLARTGTTATSVPEGWTGVAIARPGQRFTLTDLNGLPGRRFSMADLKVNGTNTPLVNELRKINKESRNYEDWVQKSSVTIMGAQLNGRSAYADEATNVYLTSQFGLSSEIGRRVRPGREPLNFTGGLEGGTARLRKEGVIDAMANRFQTMRNDMESDMRLRRMYTQNGSLDTKRYINEIALPRVRQQLTASGVRFTSSQERTYERAIRLRMNTILTGDNDLKSMKRTASSIYSDTSNQFNQFYTTAADRANRAAGSSEGTAAAVRMAMARQLTQTTANPRGRRIVSPGHADLVLRDHFHHTVRGQRSSYLISSETARRVASELTGSRINSDDEAERILLGNGIRASTRSTSPRTGNPAGYTGARLKTVSQLADTYVSQGLTWEAAYRRAQQDIAARERRGDTAVDGGANPPSTAEPREDARGSSNKGKKCGESYIPRTHECRNGKSELKPAVKTAAKVALGAGVAVGAAVLIDKRFKVREYHTGAHEFFIKQEGAPRSRRAGWEMKHKVAEGPEVLKRKLDGLDSQPGVIKNNVDRIKKVIDDEDIHNDVNGLMRDLKKTIQDKMDEMPDMTPRQKKLGVSVGYGIMQGMVRIGMFGGLALGGSKNIYVKTNAPDLNKHMPNPTDVVASAGRFMDMKLDPNQADVSTSMSMKEVIQRSFIQHNVSTSSLDGNSRDTMILIHEVAHKAHFRATSKVTGKPFQAGEATWDPSVTDVANHMRKNKIPFSYENNNPTLDKFASKYGASDINGTPPKRRAETFAELSILYMTQGERFRREDPFAYAWCDMIWEKAAS